MNGQTTEQRTKVIPKAEALGMVKPRNHAMLNAGAKLSVKPGVLIQRVKVGSALRYRLTYQD